MGKHNVAFDVFTPLGLAAIGKLPLPILDRSIVLNMVRAPRNSTTRFDTNTIPAQALVCKRAADMMFAWARDCQLNPNPPIPAELINRVADNWRVLISIADAASPEWGKAARAAALVLSAEKDEDLPVRLLYDIRDVFDRQPLDRLSTNVLLTELFDLPDARWSELKLTDRRLASLLAPFKIKPKRLWPARRTIATKSFRGYLRSDFEKAWASYCDDGVTPSHANNIRHLRSK